MGRPAAPAAPAPRAPRAGIRGGAARGRGGCVALGLALLALAYVVFVLVMSRSGA